jgi:hypothetical protein
MIKQQTAAITSQSALTFSEGRNAWVTTPIAHAPATASMTSRIVDIFITQRRCNQKSSTTKNARFYAKITKKTLQKKEVFVE